VALVDSRLLLPRSRELLVEGCPVILAASRAVLQAQLQAALAVRVRRLPVARHCPAAAVVAVARRLPPRAELEVLAVSTAAAAVAAVPVNRRLPAARAQEGLAHRAAVSL
jgi:hypothetical protein